LFTILIAIHVLICIGLILVILMQSSKGEGLAGAFGGSSLSGAVFGGRGAATFLSKATSILAVAFMVSCLTLTFISPARRAERASSAIKKEMQQQQLPGSQSTTLPGEGSPTSQPAGNQAPITAPAGQKPTAGNPAQQQPPKSGGK
jgi:preprotein translocase subunit SecG